MEIMPGSLRILMAPSPVAGKSAMAAKLSNEGTSGPSFGTTSRCRLHDTLAFRQIKAR
jgi:hypothetical protein